MRYLLVAEVEEIKKLRNEGGMIKAIALQFGVCEATISKIINGKTGARTMCQSKQYSRIPKETVTVVEEVFQGLPDTVLFEHVKECNFIG